MSAAISPVYVLAGSDWHALRPVWTNGALAVVPMLRSRGNGSFYPSPTAWTIAHIPTGWHISSLIPEEATRDLAAVRAFAESLASVADWATVRPCDLDDGPLRSAIIGVARHWWKRSA